MTASANDSSRAQERIPARVGKYVVTRALGKGTSGIVYLCHDPFLGKDVALKLYPLGEWLPDADIRQRRQLFFNEAKLAGRLQHPNILPIYDAGEGDGHCYVVMEYVRGAEPLTKFCEPHHLLPVRRVVEVVFKCAKALDHAHRQGVVHRDIKPGNILLTEDGDVRIVDLGIAQLDGVNAEPDKGLVGSPSYMAPEQVRGGRATSRSDLFSLGVVMYELLAGKRPFFGENLSRLVHQIIYATPVPLHKLREDIPQVLEDIVARALEKDPEKRYRSGLEFAADLTRAFKELERLAEEMLDQERFNRMRTLPFFADFSYPEIWEVLHASRWYSFAEGDQIVDEGRVEDTFLLMVSGEAAVHKRGREVRVLRAGDCFGEAGFVGKARQSATIVARTQASLMRVNATLLEQASLECQLRFNRVFLRNLVERLARAQRPD